MTGRSMLDAIGQVDDRFLQEAQEEPVSAPRMLYLKRLVPLAACLALILSGLLWWNPFRQEEIVQEGQQYLQEGQTMQLLLRVESWQEDRFIATVLQGPLEPDTQVIVAAEDSTYLITEPNSTQGFRGIPTPDAFPVESVLQVTAYSYDSQENTLYVNVIVLTDK